MAKGKKFKKVHLCATLEFGDKNEKIKQWVEANGGTYSRSINPDVTHLVCTETAFKKGHDLVKEAKRVRGLKIVSFDWLEDSLMSKGQSVKREGAYMWKTIMKGKRKKDFEKKTAKNETISEAVKAFEKGVKDFQNEMGATGYHLYTDPTSFTYSITLARPYILTNTMERLHMKVGAVHSPVYSSPSCSSRASSVSTTPFHEHSFNFNASPSSGTGYDGVPDNSFMSLLAQTPTLVLLAPDRNLPYPVIVPIVRPMAQTVQIYESDTTPHTYCAYIKYSRRGGVTGKDMLAPMGSAFDTTFAAFRKFFKLKTGKAWENRNDGIKSQAMKDPEGKMKEWFQYNLPGTIVGVRSNNGDGKSKGTLKPVTIGKGLMPDDVITAPVPKIKSGNAYATAVEVPSRFHKPQIPTYAQVASMASTARLIPKPTLRTTPDLSPMDLDTPVAPDLGLDLSLDIGTDGGVHNKVAMDRRMMPPPPVRFYPRTSVSPPKNNPRMPNIIDLTGDEEVEACVKDVLQLAEATMAESEVPGEWW